MMKKTVFAFVLAITALSTSTASAAPIGIGSQKFIGIGHWSDELSAIQMADMIALEQGENAGYPSSSCRRTDGPEVHYFGPSSYPINDYVAYVEWTCTMIIPGTISYTELRAGHTGMCAAVGDNSTKAGMWFIQYKKCDGKENKKFDLVPTGTPSQYYLQVRSTKMCMVPKELSGLHVEIVQNPCQSSDEFRWTLDRQADGKYTMRNGFDSSLCLGVAYGGTNSGMPLDQAPCGSFAGQVWTIPGLGSPSGGGGGIDYPRFPQSNR